MGKSVLYLGDTTLEGAGAYLAGVMSYHNSSFDYLPSDRRFDSALFNNKYQAIIISDYPAGNFSNEQMDTIVEKVAEGMGLLMIGGWESFAGGQYTETALSEVLPVIMQAEDDRVNCFAPCLVEKVKEHEILGSLPFEENPPCIGGFNRLKSKPAAAGKPDSDTILLARRFKASYLPPPRSWLRQEAAGRDAEAGMDGNFTITPLYESDPLLVVGTYPPGRRGLTGKQGRVCAFATDAAPHWVGGLVDWGNSRVIAQGPGARPIEVGNWYAELLANMINWTARRL
jgi:uncharacterized membrane protein